MSSEFKVRSCSAAQTCIAAGCLLSKAKQGVQLCITDILYMVLPCEVAICASFCKPGSAQSQHLQETSAAALWYKHSQTVPKGAED